MKAKRETKTNAGGEPQGTAYHVRARMSRGRVGPNVVGARGRSSNHGDVGSTQKETLVDSTEMPRWRQSTVVKARNANMMRKVKGHSKPAMEVPITMAGRLLRPVNGVNNVTTLEGRSDSGNNTSKRSKVTQPKPDTPQKCGRQKILGWTSLRRPVPNGRQHGPYSLTCRYTIYYGGYIVVGSFARKQGNAQDTCWKRKGETEKAQKTT